jgi:hypothetical protein
VIRIVPQRQIDFYCGAKATSCYVGDSDTGTLTVLAGRSLVVAAVLRHEYAHNIDATYDLTLTDGTSNHAVGWWRARKIDQRLRRGEVAGTTRRGWERSIREIFAEDFMRLHTKCAVPDPLDRTPGRKRARRAPP